MRWIRRSRIGVVGFFGGPREPITAAIPPVEEDRYFPIIVPCSFYDDWTIFLTVSGLLDCPCTAITDSPGFSQESTVNGSGVFPLTLTGGVWESGTVPYTFRLYSGDECDSLIEEITGTFIYQVTCLNGGFTIRTTSTGGQEFFISDNVTVPNSGVPFQNQAACSNSAQATHLGQATLSGSP